MINYFIRFELILAIKNAGSVYSELEFFCCYNVLDFSGAGYSIAAQKVPPMFSCEYIALKVFLNHTLDTIPVLQHPNTAVVSNV